MSMLSLLRTGIYLPPMMYLWNYFPTCLAIFSLIRAAGSGCPGSESKPDQTGVSGDTAVQCFQESGPTKKHIDERPRVNPFEDELRSLTTSPSECSRTVTDDAGEITSPNWPRKSTDHLECEIDIVVEGSRRIILKFNQFEFVGGDDCSNENSFVQITDVQYNRTEKICGSNAGFVWTSDGNYVSVLSWGDTNNAPHVFHATYTAAVKYGCGETFSNAFGMFSHYIPLSTVVSNVSSNGTRERDVTADEETSTSSPVCELLFHTTPAQKMSVTFEDIDVLCDGPLTLYDPFTGSYTLVCNTYNDVSWTSTGNELLVRYAKETTRDLSLAYETLMLEGSSEPYCKNILGGDTGRFSSPFHPPYYPAEPECWTLIHTSLNSIIRIVFENFSVGKMTTEGCVGDYVQISDLTTEHVDRVCGTTYPFTWTSDSNEALVVFSPGSDLFALPTFEAAYTTLTRYDSGDCFRFDEDESYEVVTSRGFPDLLHPDQNCQYLLHAFPGKYLVMQFTDFDLGEGTPCHKQYLEVTDVILKRTDTFCSILPDFVWTSNGNEVLLRLVTAKESDEVGRGFRLAYRELPQPLRQLQQSDCKTVLYDPDGAITYPLATSDGCSGNTPCDCLYVIHGRPGTCITVHFLDLSIDNPTNGEFPRSIVQISEPSAVSVVPVVEDITSTEPSFSWTSRLNELHIRVIEYADTQGVRISAEYRTAELKENIEDILVYVTDTQGSYSVPANCPVNKTVCNVLIHAQPSERVLIRFNYLNFTTNSCRLNSLKVTDFQNGDEQTFCDNLRDFALLSSGNEILLTFRSSPSEEPVEASFTHVTKRRPPENGNHLFLTGSQGEISSRTSSGASQTPSETTDRESSVVIIVQPDERVVLKFKNLVLPNRETSPVIVQRRSGTREAPVTAPIDNTCLDGIQITDLTTGEEELVCEGADHYSWTSSTNAVQVRYNLSLSIASHGFRATYNAIPRYGGFSARTEDPTGFIPLDRTDGQYLSNTRKQWLIHAQPGDIISLVTNDFVIEESPGCTKDYVKIEDQFSGKTAVLCGYHQTVWVSDSNEALLTFESDEDVEDEGFIFSYEVVPDRYTGNCFYRFTSESGEFDFGEDEKEAVIKSAGSNVFCQFIFETEFEKRLRLKISGLTMVECNIAELIFVDLGSYRTTEVCRVQDTIGWTSDLNGVFLHVLSFQQEVPSFVLSWEAVDRPSPPECYIAITEEESVLDLSSLQSFDERWSKCVISVNYKPENRIVIALHDVISASENCSTLITIEDSVSGRMSRLCDIGPSPNTWTSESNEATITIEQTGAEGIMGESKIYFNSTYRPPRSDCSKTLTAESGVLISDGFPDHYPPNQNCSVLLHADQDQRIRITMEEFAVEGNGSNNCEWTDFLQITDVSSLTSVRACGRLHPFTWTSSGNELLLAFISDASLELKGYRGSYEIQPAITAVEDCNVTFSEASGQLTLPNFYTWYHLLPYVRCRYLIQARPSERIVISFEDITLFSNEECSDTYAVINDVLASQSVDLCGELSAFEWVSTSNAVEIRFETSAPRTDHELRASYRVETREPPPACDKRFSFMDATNVISSEGFNDGGYYNDLDCTYVIEGRPNQIIEITFDHFDLENSELCQYDYVELKTPMEVGPRFCGTRPSFAWWSDGNVAGITFHTDHVITRSGFTAHFEFITTEVITTTDCNQNLTDVSGNFTSPGYPGNYDYNLDCNYTIQVEGGKVVQMLFTRFELETDVECKFDFIELSSLPEGRVIRYCGQRGQFNWTSLTNKVLVSFHSDGTGSFAGFAATFTTVESSSVTTGGTEAELPACSKNFADSAGFFASPSFPDDYESNEDCRIDYTAAIGSRVIINLLFLDLEYEPSCKLDYIQFVDIEAEQRSPRMCGRMKDPSTWESEGNKVAIIFHSDEIVQRGGFYGLITEIPA